MCERPLFANPVTYHDQGYIQSPDSGIQLQGTLNKIMETQAQMKQLIDGLVSHVTKLGNSFSSTCSSCSSSPEGKTKKAPHPAFCNDVASSKVFNVNEYYITEVGFTNP